MTELATGGNWDVEAVDYAIDNLPNAHEAMERALKACEDPNSVVRFRFAGGPWDLRSGPQLLAQLKHEQGETLTIDSVTIRRLGYY